MRDPRPLVLDANILIRAALGPRVRSVIEKHAGHADFFVPAYCTSEAKEHLPSIVAKRGWDTEPIMASFNAIVDLLHVVESPAYSEAMEEALERLSGRDPLDADILALALTLACPIWTEDRDFFGTGVATWTSARVERYLAPAHVNLTRGEFSNQNR